MLNEVKHNKSGTRWVPVMFSVSKKLWRGTAQASLSEGAKNCSAKFNMPNS